MNSDQNQRKTDKTLKYFAWLLYGIALVGLFFTWVYFSDTGLRDVKTWKLLIQSLIPNILSPLIIFGILYIFFFRKRINIEKIIHGESADSLETGYESHDEVNWELYLANSRKLVIVAFFFDDWIKENSDYFDEFLEREDFLLLIYLPDYTELNLLSKINAIIPEHTQEELSKKIQESIAEIKKRTANKTQQVNVSLYSKPFNYTYQLFDKKMILSFNILNRSGNYKSPFIILNLENSKNLHKFFIYETQALEAHSKPINLNQWTQWTTQALE